MDEDGVKGRILKVAAELFMERGFGGTSVRDIGERAGVGQSSLYHHVQSKGHLLEQLHHTFARELIASLELVASSEASAVEQFRELVRVLLTTIETRGSEVTVYLREHHALPAESKEQIQQERDRIDALVDEIIRRGIVSGEFRDDLDVHLTRLAVLGMCNWSYEWYRPSGKSTMSEISDYFADFALRAVLAGHG
jgi:AcrR family transcriptional regulator